MLPTVLEGFELFLPVKDAAVVHNLGRACTDLFYCHPGG
jgi:hypothetical protein